MKTVKPSSQSYVTDTTLEQENQLIAEAKHLLYGRLRSHGELLSSPPAVRDYLRLQLLERDHEVFCCLFLDSQHRLIEYRELFVGTIDGCSVYPREVARACLDLNAAACIFAHNHPSGIPDVSQSDKRITERLKSALSLFDIRVLDHLIVGGTDIFSFAEQGLI